MAQKSKRKMYTVSSLWIVAIVAAVAAALVAGLMVRAAIVADTDKNGVLATTNSRPALIIANDETRDMVNADLTTALSTYESVRPCINTYRIYKATILAITPDKTQALVGFSCGGIGVEHGVITKTTDGWQKIGAPLFGIKGSVANTDFDSPLDVPSCSIVNQYKLQKAVAPVCYTKHGSSYSYTAR